jgi:polyhydroxyalkanoate synthesis regulator phasin
MGDIISKALLTGLGLASLTKDAIEKTVSDIASRSNLSEAEGRRLVKDLQKRSGEAQKALEEKVESVVHDVLERFHLTTIPKKAPAKRAKSSRKSGAKAGRRGAAKS